MKDFNIEKKGYSIKEVDDYIIMQQIENDRVIKEKQSRINELREENFKLIRDINSFRQKEESISNALLLATEKAKEIEEIAKLEYRLELKILDNFYKKWNDFFDELITRYPKMNDFSTKNVLDNINEDIKDLIGGTFQSNKNLEKNNVKDLINKLHSHSKNKERKKIPLKINQKINQDIIFESENEFEYQEQANKINNIKPISNLSISNDEKDEFENLVDKFLHSENKISKGYEKSILNTNKKSKYPKPNESGFDFEQALNPTDNLSEIMKGFKLD